MDPGGPSASSPFFSGRSRVGFRPLDTVPTLIVRFEADSLQGGAFAPLRPTGFPVYASIMSFGSLRASFITATRGIGRVVNPYRQVHYKPDSPLYFQGGDSGDSNPQKRAASPGAPNVAKTLRRTGRETRTCSTHYVAGLWPVFSCQCADECRAFGPCFRANVLTNVGPLARVFEPTC
jgi:hypothetical protein